MACGFKVPVGYAGRDFLFIRCFKISFNHAKLTYSVVFNSSIKHIVTD